VLIVIAAGAAHAYPDKPIRIIVPFSAGTITDVFARDFAAVLSPVVKQPVVVENRTGAEGIIGVQALLASEPDGHSILFSSGSLAILDPLLKKDLPYDPTKDMTPVCSVGSVEQIMYMTASLPYKNVAEFVAAAKAEPGKFTYAYSSAFGRLNSELFQEATGTKLTGVPYRSTATGLTDVATGRVDLYFVDHGSAAAYSQAGKVRPMVVAGAKQIKSVPNVPTAVAAGIPSFDSTPTYSVYVPSKTPKGTTDRLRDLVAEALKSPAMAAVLEKRELGEFSLCGDAVVKYHQDERERLRKVITKAGIEPQ